MLIGLFAAKWNLIWKLSFYGILATDDASSYIILHQSKFKIGRDIINANHQVDQACCLHFDEWIKHFGAKMKAFIATNQYHKYFSYQRKKNLLVFSSLLYFNLFVFINWNRNVMLLTSNEFWNWKLFHYWSLTFNKNIFQVENNASIYHKSNLHLI